MNKLSKISAEYWKDGNNWLGWRAELVFDNDSKFCLYKAIEAFEFIQFFTSRLKDN